MPLMTVDGLTDADSTEFLLADNLKGGDAQISVDLPNDIDPIILHDQFYRIQTIRIPFPSASDGRGFSIARRLRHLGYSGRLRAQGHLISDQFRYALDCGFDEVEINDALSQRQPESHWRDFGQPGYQQKLSNHSTKHEKIAEFHVQRVIDVHHYSDDLFRFRITRPDNFRFKAGEFAMLGLQREQRNIFGAYSMTSGIREDSLEFYSTKAVDGELSRQLKWIRPGDEVLLQKETSGPP